MNISLLGNTQLYHADMSLISNSAPIS